MIAWISKKLKISVNDLQEVVTKLDADADGYISVAELIKGVKGWLKK
jgi:Ca2+-binding EF-hand superfamily protein